MADDTVQMAHGAGGHLARQLMEEYVLPALSNPLLAELHDGVVLPTHGPVAFTTDSFVVQPLFFPGGSIGRLAVCGTVNDLAMTGAAARYLSLALILEEGFPLSELRRVLVDVRQAADEAGVAVVTGDTKVVGRGAGDGIYINTAGVGEMLPGAAVSPRQVRPEMAVIVSGYLGDHAATVIAARHGLELPPDLTSDAAPLKGLVAAMLGASPRIAVLRDPTRGGAAAVLNELAEQAGVGILLEEEAVPVRPSVAGVCELLGFDPLYLANEGKLIAIVEADDADKILAAMHRHPLGENAAVIGRTTREAPGQVGLKTAFGGIRLVEMPLGELVPRIC